MNLTAEDLYQIYHKETNFAAGRPVRQVKNFENAKKKTTWKHFELLASFVNRNCGQIDGRLYVKSLATFFEGYFDPSLFCTPKATKIYKEYITEISMEATPESIKKHLLRSIKFIVKYCRQKNIKNLCEYMNEDMYFIPTSLKHLDAGSISMYFLAAIKNLRVYIDSYPIDCKMDYLPNFDEDYSKYRMRLISVRDLKKIWDNVEEIIDDILSKEPE